jgi:hypothetical protein
MTILNKNKVLSFMDELDLEPSLFEFHTANEELLEGVGQFYTTLQLCGSCGLVVSMFNS